MFGRSSLTASCALVFALAACSSGSSMPSPPPEPPEPEPPGTLHQNPLLDEGADPSLEYFEGNYYLVQSGGGGLTVTESSTLTGLADVAPTQVWTSGGDGSPEFNNWAPEIHHLEGRWYIYYAGSDTEGEFLDQRSHVIEADEPLGPYSYAGQLDLQPDRWAIDGTVLEYDDGRLYFVWSGWEGEELTIPVTQKLYIAPLSDPTTVSGERVLISEPDMEWEQQGGLFINEGPDTIFRGDKVHIVYSASSSMSDFYCLATLTADVTSDPLEPDSWTKSDGCLFEQNKDAGLYGPGHNNLVESPDGTQDWNVYHANLTRGAGWDGRSVHMQQFGWRADDSPFFGIPVGPDAEIAVPSGEPGSDSRRYEAEYGMLDGGEARFDLEASSAQVLLLRASESISFDDVDAGEGLWVACVGNGGGTVGATLRIGSADPVDLACPAPGADAEPVFVPGALEGSSTVVFAAAGTVRLDFIELVVTP